MEGARDHAGAGARHAGPRVQAIAGMGYVAKGVVYATIGTLAMMEAFGEGGKTASPDGAMRGIGFQPFGGFLLIDSS